MPRKDPLKAELTGGTLRLSDVERTAVYPLQAIDQDIVLQLVAGAVELVVFLPHPVAHALAGQLAGALETQRAEVRRRLDALDAEARAILAPVPAEVQ